MGEDQPGDDEIAVVPRLAEVTAVGEVVLGLPAGTGGTALGDSVVDPLPDEAALQPRMRLDQLLIIGQAPGTVALGVGVLAHDERELPAARVQRGISGPRLLPVTHDR